MSKLPFRQVHLDFHTSGCIDGVGAEFNKREFQETLKLGHVNSVTVFSKCHHGYSYFPSEVNEPHPGLVRDADGNPFDLLGAELEACREIGVRAPVYISAGLDEKEAIRHPEWLLRAWPDQSYNFMTESWYHVLCFNTPYMDLLESQIEETVKRYNPTEIFMDICDVRVCYCNRCIKSMRENGLNPRDPADALKWAERVYSNYCARVERAVRKYSKDAAVFHNAGSIYMGRRDLAEKDTHLELESLPTGGWGYDHFPMSAAYSRCLGKEYLGMTGKFHTTWGEFGGFKHPNALIYETSLSLSLGAKCSIGDQLHPSGKLNKSTYDLIGKAYSRVEAKEPWCGDVNVIADIAILSAASAGGTTQGKNSLSDIGANRILLENKYLYDFIDTQADFSPYKLLVLPDEVHADAALAEKLKSYLANGGKILATGLSGTSDGSGDLLGTGLILGGANQFMPNYMIPESDAGFTNGKTEYVMYSGSFNVTDASGEFDVAASSVDPYFNRTADHFSSHQHTPNMPNASTPAVFVSGNFAYVPWKIFVDYATKGELHVKELAALLIDKLIGKEKTVTVHGMPDRGIVTLTEQPQYGRMINHLLFAHTCVRGTNTEVIEDAVPLYNVQVEIKSARAPKSVSLVPEQLPMEFKYQNGVISYTVEKLQIHQMVEIQF